MKRTIRVAVLIAATVGTFMVAAAQLAATDGGPLLLCQPGQRNCQTTVPPIM